jgi:hypothetical protein
MSAWSACTATIDGNLEAAQVFAHAGRSFPCCFG